MDIHDQLDALNPQPGERWSINHLMKGWPTPRSAILTPEAIPAYVTTLPLEAEIWIGMNPVGPHVVSGRGTAADVTRLTSLYCDLDVKEGACANLGVAEQITDDLCNLLGETFTTMVYSGHGIQPTWAIDPEETATNAEMAALLRRWGQLVKLVAKHRGASADSVFDLARILRVVGTRNNKDEIPIEVVGLRGDGGPMTYQQISDRLDEAGIYAPPTTDYNLADSGVVEAGWAKTECWYATQTFNGWATETPTERHPWLVAQYTRLEAMRILGCLTHSQYRSGAKLLADRFAALRAGVNGVVRPMEIESCAAWGADKAKAKSRAELLAEVGGHEHDIFGDIVKDRAAQQVPPQPSISVANEEETHTEATLNELHANIFQAEDDFWSATPALKMIYEASLARMVSPWAVFAWSAARVLQLVPPTVELPGLVGLHGSLNWFAIVVAKSSGGKSAAEGLAEQIVSVPFPQEINDQPIGSGEGMIGRFFEPDPNDPKKKIRRDAVLFKADEIDDLTAQSQRQGGTTLPMIRTAFSGGTLGHSYITTGRDIKVKAHTYRMTMVVNAQPSRCGALLEDAGGGTPQRFMWFPATDLRPSIATSNLNHYPPGVTLPHGLATLGDKRIQIPPEALEESLLVIQGNCHGKLDGMHGHANFSRLKLAYALALLDGRTDMSSEDWRLSGIAAEVSRRTLTWVQAALAEEQVVEARKQGALRGISFAAADESKTAEAAKTARRVQNWALGKLKKKGPMTLGALKKDAVSRDRGQVEAALNSLVADGLVAFLADGERWSAR